MSPPGFIDLQVNGYGGIDFCDPNTRADDVLEAASVLRQKGTAGFLATITTNDRDAIEQCIATVTKAIDRQGEDGSILGIHLEGPFLSPEYGYRGAHPEACICPPDIEWFRRLREIAQGNLRLVTIAPEHENALEFIRTVAPDVLVSAGHTCADFSSMKAATATGMSLFTHIGNGCRQQIDRHNNIIMNAIACSELTLCFIPDSFHLPEAFIRMLFSCRPDDKLIAVSDSVAVAGLPPGRYNLLKNEVLLTESGRLHLASDADVMAGSSANLFQCMNHLASLGFLDVDTMWRVGYYNPLRVLGIHAQVFAERPAVVRLNDVSGKFETET